LRFNGKDVVVDVPSSVAVVVPARNEERRLAACLSALQAAVGQLLGGGDATPVRVVLVLDRCTDGSAAVAARWPSVQVVTTRHGRVGAARAAGIRHAAALAGVYPETTWIATTDADSVVPADWLQTQLHFARAGADLLLGMVRPSTGSVRVLGMDDVDGVRTTHYRFNIDRDKATQGMPEKYRRAAELVFERSGFKGSVFRNAEVWLDDQGRPRRLVVRIHQQVRSDLAIVGFRLNMKQFGQPVSIDEPIPDATSTVADYPQLVSSRG